MKRALRPLSVAPPKKAPRRKTLVHDKTNGKFATKYDPRFCELLVAHCAEGFSYSSFGATIGVTRRTTTTWRGDHPEFDEACERAEDALQLWNERTAMDFATGKRDPRAVVAFIWRSKNVGKWRDRTEADVHVSTDKSPAEQAAELGAYDKLRG